MLFPAIGPRQRALEQESQLRPDGRMVVTGTVTRPNRVTIRFPPVGAKCVFTGPFRRTFDYVAELDTLIGGFWDNVSAIAIT
jgi:hypothetical protein